MLDAGLRQPLEVHGRVGEPVGMGSHDPVLAAYAEGVGFLADGAIGDEINTPTAAVILDRMKGLGA